MQRKVQVDEVFGSLPIGIIGSGRETEALPPVETSEAKRHIRLAHNLGMKFSYPINASCLGNIEHTAEGRRRVREYLDLIIGELDVDSVIVTIPLLIELIRREFPKVEITASTINHIKSVQEARFYESLGATRLSLSYMTNRNFSLLKSIIDSTGCAIEVLTNESCLYHCPFRSYHYNVVSHASQQGIKIVQYPLLKCTVEKLKNPAELVKARWIRPEDIKVYEDLGITYFKLAGREKNTEWLLRCAESYSRREYRGNLLDIIAIPTLATDKFGLEAPETLAFPPISLDNQKLQGFLSFFEKNGDKCDWDCDKCSYCSEIAKKTISYDVIEVEAYVRELEYLDLVFLDDFSKKGKEGNSYERMLLHKGFEAKVP